jgi:hypothetical protein
MPTFLDASKSIITVLTVILQIRRPLPRHLIFPISNIYFNNIINMEISTTSVRNLNPYADVVLNMPVDAGVGGDQPEVLEECCGRLFTIEEDIYGLIFIKFLSVEKDLTIPELAGAPNLRYVKFFTLDNMNNNMYYKFDHPIFRQLPMNFVRLILVVHWSYFKDFIIQEIRGKHDLFAYQGPLDQEIHNRDVYPPFPNYDIL